MKKIIYPVLGFAPSTLFGFVLTQAILSFAFIGLGFRTYGMMVALVVLVPCWYFCNKAYRKHQRRQFQDFINVTRAAAARSESEPQ